MSCTYPKVLIINNEPFHSGSATGLTMSSLFFGWPSDRLALICPRPLPQHLTVTDRIYSLSQNDFMVPKGFRFLHNALMVFSDYLGTKNLTLFGKICNNFLRMFYIFPYKIDGSLSDWIEDFQPDLIYTMLCDLDIMLLCLQLSRKYNLPITPHFMDDWVASVFFVNPVRSFLSIYSHFLLKQVLKRSRHPMVICDAMSHEYVRRFQIDFAPFMRCIEDTEIANGSDACNVNPVRFIYIGGLHLDRWRSLQDIGIAMQCLNARGVPVQVEIYVHPIDLKRYGARLNLPLSMKVIGSLPSHSVIEMQRNADVLMHVESFASVNVKFTRYSISAKIPEYLAAGKPILAYGPSNIASIDFLRTNGCASVVSQRSTEALADAIAKLADSFKYRQQLGMKALKLAKSRFAASVERDRFREHLRTVMDK